METLPSLRGDIHIIPLRAGEEEVIVVQDPLGISGERLVLKAAAGYLLGLFDGRRTLADLQAAVSPPGEEAPPLERLREVVSSFDRLGLLDTPRYRAARQRLVDSFAAAAVRPAALAGEAYPVETGPLGELLDGILADGEATGAPRGGDVAGLAAPHIDLRAGAAAYGSAYRALRGSGRREVLLLGTGHALPARYALTAKTFVSPLGAVAADARSVETLRGAGDGIVAPDDFAHRSEHSLEFQLLFLQHLFPSEELRVLPILCGPLEDLCLKGSHPFDLPPFRSFVAALSDWLAAGDRLAVAGVDLCHIGPKFGDPVPARELEAEFTAHDRSLLEALESGDADLFYHCVAAVGNRYRVCGFSALWTLLAALPGARGKILDYRVWHEEATNSAVSFAAVSFTCGQGGTKAPL